MLLDAETRRRGETRGEHLFRIGFRACKATQESQNLGARRQRRAYGFAARLTLGWKADQRSARRCWQGEGRHGPKDFCELPAPPADCSVWVGIAWSSRDAA